MMLASGKNGSGKRAKSLLYLFEEFSVGRIYYLLDVSENRVVRRLKYTKGAIFLDEGNGAEREEEKSMKKIVIGSDHGGLDLKGDITTRLKNSGYEVVNVGIDSLEETKEYPDIAVEACEKVVNKEVDCGILICGTGIGICMAANKVRGIRAATCSDTFSARKTKEHNDANVLALGARVIGNEHAWEVVLAYLGAEFKGGRHQHRVDKITKLDEGR